MVKMKVVMPKGLILDAKKLTRAIDNTLDGSALAVKVDFEVTQQTWKHKAKFKIIKKAGSREVSTGDTPYTFVSGGTKPHIIRPKSPSGVLRFQQGYNPKTTPRVIQSRQGGPFGGVVYRQEVRHPGTEARDFDKVIAKKWQKELPVTMQRAIDAEVN